jgi:hypothetical protein
VILVFAFEARRCNWSRSGRLDDLQLRWLVLPALAYLLWHHRKRFFADPRLGLTGIAASAGCGVAWLVFDLPTSAWGGNSRSSPRFPASSYPPLACGLFAR